jgi:hypothetical protein
MREMPNEERCWDWSTQAPRSRTLLNKRLRHVEHDRGPKPSTVVGYTLMVWSLVLPVFGVLSLDDVPTLIVVS